MNDTMPNYVTLACEVCLYAYNDYVRRTIDLMSLEMPKVNKYTATRNLTITNKLWKESQGDKRYARHHPNLQKIKYEERLKSKKAQYRRDIIECKQFFEDEGPLTTVLGATSEEVLEKAHKDIKRWLETGRLELVTSVRPLETQKVKDKEDDGYEL